ncbi:hypothetical protein EDEG_01932 [Edhazardia aedis USNM 41457]|uniref:Uncharacterized protein n=1 Tax=Edhazardia aedis (strain USNM 41457) TaxID=1003232 RepID=J9D7K9_EDHAE|nr:hypothetical protein EDEG_01932 [Edhazardia aedis USNM 41457]|eukprot:EJW03776.1 hypothetical protein EDEG_01932 [Edhazardia aedis USNM 41457]
MDFYTIEKSIPTEAKCPQISRDTILFASGNNIYHDKHLASLSESIVSLSFNKTFIFASTSEFLYQLSYTGKIITKLKLTRKCELIKCTDNYIFLGYNNIVEVFMVPTSYKKVMYTLKRRFYGNPKPVSFYPFNNFLLVGFNDNCLKIFCVESGAVKNIGIYTDNLLQAYMNAAIITVVAQNTIYFYKICKKRSKYEKIKIRNNECHEEFDKPKFNCNDSDHENNEESDQKDVDDYEIQNNTQNKISADLNNYSFELYKKIQKDNILFSTFDGNRLFIAVKQENENDEDISEILYYDNCELQQKCEHTFPKMIHLYSDKASLLIKLDEKLVMYNYLTNIIAKEIPTTQINIFKSYGNSIFASSMKSINIYKSDTSCLKEQSLDVTTKIIHLFGSRNVLLTISSLGTAKLFDIRNFFCFKKFDISFQILCATVDDDFSILLLGSNSIFVYDLKRGKLIDEIKGHTGPIVKLIVKGSYVFSFSIDNFIRKNDIYSSVKDSKELENLNNKTIIDFIVSKNVYVLFNSEINVYDLNFEFIKTISFSEKNIKFFPEKINVINESVLFIYGKSGDKFLIKVVSVEHGITIQEIIVDKLVNIDVHLNSLICLSESNFVFYKQRQTKFEPLDLEIDITEDKIIGCIDDNNWFLALLGSLKLGSDKLIEYVVNNIPIEAIDNIVKITPQRYIPRLRSSLNKFDKSSEWLEKVMFYHKKTGDILEINPKELDAHEYAKQNLYILEAIARIGKSKAIKKN